MARLMEKVMGHLQGSRGGEQVCDLVESCL